MKAARPDSVGKGEGGVLRRHGSGNKARQPRRGREWVPEGFQGDLRRCYGGSEARWCR